MPQIFGTAFEHRHPIMDSEAGDRGPQPGGALDLAVEERGSNVWPEHRQHQPRDARAASDVEEPSRGEERGPRRGVVDVALHWVRAQETETTGVLEDDAEVAEVGHVGRITT